MEIFGESREEENRRNVEENPKVENVKFSVFRSVAKSLPMLCQLVFSVEFRVLGIQLLILMVM